MKDKQNLTQIPSEKTTSQGPAVPSSTYSVLRILLSCTMYLIHVFFFLFARSAAYFSFRPRAIGGVWGTYYYVWATNGAKSVESHLAKFGLV